MCQLTCIFLLKVGYAWQNLYHWFLFCMSPFLKIFSLLTSLLITMIMITEFQMTLSNYFYINISVSYYFLITNQKIRVINWKSGDKDFTYPWSAKLKREIKKTTKLKINLILTIRKRFLTFLDEPLTHKLHNNFNRNIIKTKFNKIFSCIWSK